MMTHEPQNFLQVYKQMFVLYGSQTVKCETNVGNTTARVNKE